MEFFAIVELSTSQEALQTLSIDKLSQYCAEIEQVFHIEHENSGKIYCLWGEFTVHRQVINGGVRFSMPHCPNALAWTITTGFAPEPDKVLLHCTINRTEHDPDFIESIQDFIQAWKLGLEQHFS